MPMVLLTTSMSIGEGRVKSAVTMTEPDERAPLLRVRDRMAVACGRGTRRVVAEGEGGGERQRAG